jgi:14-3-3 protein epsilon
MVEFMKTVAKVGGPELSVEERNFLSLGYKNVVGARRASWRMITSQLQDDEKKDNVAHLEDYKEYRDKVEKELHSICQDALDLLDNHLIPQATTGESRVFYLKMKGDYLRYMAECISGDARKPIADLANGAYQEATKVALEQLTPTQPIRLGLALNYSVFFYEIMGMPKEACQLAREAFDSALAEIDVLPEESYRDSSVIMQLLRDNMNLWAADEQSKQQQAENVGVGGAAASAEAPQESKAAK